MGVCTPGDSVTWRKLVVHYTMHSDYSSDRSATATGNFYARPGEECVDIREGLIPNSVDSCERYDVAKVAK